jgi:predicted sugar kinase
MQLELTSPACLLLGVVNIDGAICQLGLALQYPPIQLSARASTGLLVTGGRADLARQQAERFLAHHRLPGAAEIEIELAVPSHMGLGSQPLMGLAVARALAELHGLPIEQSAEHAAAAGLLTPGDELAARTFEQGGLLLVDAGGRAVRRQAIPPRGDEADWVWVLVLPRVPAKALARLEATRTTALRAVARSAVVETALLAETMFEAAAADDIAAFAGALGQLQLLNQAALDRAGKLAPLGDDDRATLATMREHGALVCGRAPGGLALYALVRGGGPSRAMRRALTERLGLLGPAVMASIVDCAGARGQTS